MPTVTATVPCPHCGHELTRKEVAQLFGRLHGQSRSRKKLQALRKNALLGGRPRLGDEYERYASGHVKYKRNEAGEYIPVKKKAG